MIEQSEAMPQVSEYYAHIEQARKLAPALIKRLSNKLDPVQHRQLLDPAVEEFNPDFTYPNLFDMTPEEIEEKKQKINHGLTEAAKLEQAGHRPTVVEQFDKVKAVDGALNLSLIELAQHLQSTPDEETAHQFMEVSHQLTGEVDQHLYQGIVNSLHSLVGQVTDATPNAKQIADELLARLPASAGESRIVGLSPEVFDAYQDAYNKIFGQWLEEIIPEKSGKYSAQDMIEVFQRALQGMKFDELGWAAEADDDATSIKISMEDKKVIIPTERAALSREELGARVVHEIGHIMRGWNGSSISRNAEHGLPDYVDAEEGLMAYGEQFMRGRATANTTYVERYLGAGLMSGVLDDEKKDFRAVFAAMWRARAIFDNQGRINLGYDLTGEDLATAREDSLMNAQRLFRGSDGKLPGVGWYKDIAYYDGLAKLTQFLESFKVRYGLENVHLLFAAKFDPTNSMHNQYLGMPPFGER